ncbi:uncharacterized protein LOC122684760 [Cervus elaphus]|uniref:uncharacterized protein LOC122425530 n=1 Tax=Cervus canadensis TaxID=1574408 RepID=UPI001CA37AAD|nr:uncharacterized protein LOC122425530 [Cervus canadensis]XP_043745002.1 uncharacterized protein LOC122684760 [Cervus elaphus]
MILEIAVITRSPARIKADAKHPPSWKSRRRRGNRNLPDTRCGGAPEPLGSPGGFLEPGAQAETQGRRGAGGSRGQRNEGTRRTSGGVRVGGPRGWGRPGPRRTLGTPALLVWASKALCLNEGGAVHRGLQSLLREVSTPGPQSLLTTANRLFGEKTCDFLPKLKCLRTGDGQRMGANCQAHDIRKQVFMRLLRNPARSSMRLTWRSCPLLKTPKNAGNT